MTDAPAGNIYTSGSLPLTFIKTAAPIIIVMSVNGLFTLVDAYFLGIYVGNAALTAVTLMFPIYMMLVALSTLVSNGFSSIYARMLGAGDIQQARTVFGQAIQLSLIICMVLIAGFLLSGETMTLAVANGSSSLAGMGYTYISILIICSPLIFILSINIDALRCEGMLPAMAAITMMSALLNILFDYLFIAKLGWGVAGSAYGTILAQTCSMAAVLSYRQISSQNRKIVISTKFGFRYWRELLILGAPTSLGYIGLSLSTALTLYCLQLWGETYEITAGAFGIVTRLMTFAFLPLLGISMAFQTIVGNNFGAKQWERSNNTIKLAIAAALLYCLLIEVIFITNRSSLGFIFVDDAMIASELSRILPYSVALMFIFGPLMMISTYFQAIGDAGRAALLGLSRTYIFGLPLIFLLPFALGEIGIWCAGIIAEVLVLTLTIIVLNRRWQSSKKTCGLFEPT